jgi:myo-inositol 2-dehydrogenase/D-chiro-inositol 1-dehydrogenase/scyllo-inositol 2-dehydrogenase (NAD+)
MDVVRICLVGAGRAGLVHAKNLVGNIPHARLVAIVEDNSNTLEQRGGELGIKKLYTKLEDALSDDLFDAVVIGAPTFTHRDIAVSCAAARKHIFCEKPMTVTVNDAQRMIDAAAANKVKFQVGFMRRFDPLFLKAKQIIESGKLGVPIVIKSLARGPGLPAPWYFDVSRSNGLLGEMCSHDFDSTRWLGNGNYKRIFAEAVNRKTPAIRKQYPDFYDSVVCTIALDNGVIGTIDSTCPADYGFDIRGEVVLTKGLILIGELPGEAVLTCSVEGEIKGSAFKSWRNRFRESYVNEMTSFVEAVLNDKPPLVSGEDGLASVEAVVAGNAAIRTGMPVELNRYEPR